MDGFKKHVDMASIQLKLSLCLSLAIFLVAMVAGVFSFVSAFDEAHELQDDTLRQIAALFDQQHLPLPHLGDRGRSPHSDEDSRVIVQYLSSSKQTSGKEAEGTPLPLPNTLSDGLHTVEAGGKPFRVLAKTTANNEKIAVAQETDARDDIALDSALRTVMPFLILLPVLLLIVANLIRRIFRPVVALASEIEQRTDQDLHSIDEKHLPAEVRPFIIAINHLFARVAQSMASQRRFVADAAHELRSPLTALSLQAERLAEAELPGPTRERLALLRQGIDRSRNLLDQMLALAKAQSPAEQAILPVSIHDIYRRVLEDLMPLAEARHIDIGVEGEQDGLVMISRLDMIAMVRNLVDNAIRYTPEGGRVDMSVAINDGHAVLAIQDSGPGIPVAERQRAFDPFYRILGSDQRGSGLGLSIVKTISDRVGATIELGFSDESSRSGLRIRIFIPLADGFRSTST